VEQPGAEHLGGDHCAIAAWTSRIQAILDCTDS
jgi:hypothetical protein